MCVLCVCVCVPAVNTDVVGGKVPLEQFVITKVTCLSAASSLLITTLWCTCVAHIGSFCGFEIYLQSNTHTR